MDRFTPPRETLAQAGPMPAFERLLRVTSRLSWASEENRTTERKVLSRLTFIAEDHTQTNALLEARDVISSYDIVAIQPMTERAMMQACSVLDVDIICIDAGQRLPFKLRPPLLKNALDRGVHFEICYTSALRGGSSRWNFFNNAQALIRATHGRNIILSSSTQIPFELRGPYDVINLATQMGLSQKQAKEAITKRCEAVIARAANRKIARGGIETLPCPEGGGGGERDTEMGGA
uniref:Ribonuclease P/MRP protein subunit RPP1 n=1 Tax=Tetraselmis sp. GSL018 TaxID=582737 RepID=A0A061QLY7_9CHLO|eukprot:CAMPEP_0177619940 /NCGR_PEP_ID=MMETSP0419_2-20121207/26578_1 /TAXON_ID=582737 /ORGANISM="Tetraselmis sp., Strain GSL018" /LENGTH=234 /DNA_ID=CAMNT_0019119341 /DNA_START=429 /DNA_END=1133 /DNA_ORIENTATION=+